MSDTSANPCLSCGACCMTYRVSFYRADAAALSAGPGGEVSCSVYEQRPEPCREVQIGDDKCRHARARHGLAALS